MLSFELTQMLESYLEEKGYSFSFMEEAYYNRNSSYSDYLSLTLQIVTGVFSDKISNQDKPSYDIELVNQLTKVLMDSENEDFKKIAWNSFYPCMLDDRFILKEEMWEAEGKYYSDKYRFQVNVSPSLETGRLNIDAGNPNTTEELIQYIEENDKENEPFCYSMRNYRDSLPVVLFNLYLKESKELIGNIGISKDEKNPYVWWLQYYLKKEYRRKGYMKEAANAFLKAIEENKIIMHGQWNRQSILEDKKPTIALIKAYIFEDNIASIQMVKSLGFEYDGKRRDCKFVDDKFEYTTELIFSKRVTK